MSDVICPVDGSVGDLQLGPTCQVCGSVLPGLVELEIVVGDEPADEAV